MKIKILKSCTGFKFTFTQGETREVDDYIGNDLVKCGFAELVSDVANVQTERTAEPKTTKRRTVKNNADA